MAKNITIKLAKSLNGRLEKQVATAHSLDRKSTRLNSSHSH